jgi:hypothetical protein
MRIQSICVLALLAVPLTAVAQNITATVTGRVTDQAGAVIPGAAVTLTDVGTNTVTRAKAGEEGSFVFPLLTPGQYRLAVEQTGFKKFQTGVFPLAVEQVQRVDVSLQVGDVSESVTINERTTLVESETSSLGHVIGSREIEDLPLNGNNPMDLAEFAPGFQPLNSFGDGLQVTRAAAQMVGANNFSANGSVSGNNEILLDGVPMTVCCQGQAVFIPSANIISEVRVQTNTTTAEFGRSSGGVLNMVTKSGTNDIHGSLYEFFQNDQLNAANFFTNRSAKPPIPGRDDFRGPLRFNLFGATIGGPVDIPKVYQGKNRTFFFFGWQGTHTRTSNYTSAVVPPTALRSGDFSQSQYLIYDPTTAHVVNGSTIRDPFPNQQIPASRISNVALNYLKYFPQPDIAGVVQNYSWTGSTAVDDNQYSGRVDHVFNDANRIFGRVSLSSNANVIPDWIPNGPSGYTQWVTAETFVTDYVKILSSALVADFRYSFAKQRNKRLGNTNLYSAAALGFSADFLSEQAFSAMPPLSISGITTLGEGSRRDWDHYTHSLGASLSWVHNGHTVKTGWDGRTFIDNEYTLDTGQGSFSFSGQWTKGPGYNAALPVGSQAYYAMADFLLGTVGSGSLVYADSTARSQLYNAFFLQDDWRVTPKLTVNMGFRLEIETGFKERYDRQSSFNPYALSPLSAQVSAALGRPIYGEVVFAGVNGQPRDLWATAYNPGPRFGFAYSITPKTVIRSGAAIMFFPTTQRAYILSSRQGYSVTNSVTTNIDSINPIANIADPWPSAYPVLRPTGNSLGPNTGYGSNPNGGIYDSANSYVEQWNFGLQRELPKGFLLGVAYAGGRGVKLPINYNANDLNPALYYPVGDAAGVTALQKLYPNPFYGLIHTGSLANPTISAQTLNAQFPQYSTLQLQYMPWGFSTYNSLQVSLSQNLRAGFSMRLAYTWSKNLGDVNNMTTADSVGEGNANYQNSHLFGQEKAVSTTDIPQRLAVNGTYELPFGKRGKFLKAAIGGWQSNASFTIQSGLPLQFTDTGQATYGGSRPSFTSLDPQAYTIGSTGDRLGGISGGSGYLNKAAFRLPTYFEFGNVPRVDGDFRAPGLMNVNLSMNKYFPIREQAKLQFRAEVFNPMNHPIFGGPNVQFGSASFGTISSQLNRPRNFQLALKLMW